jgi:hypothetical protein
MRMVCSALLLLACGFAGCGNNQPVVPTPAAEPPDARGTEPGPLAQALQAKADAGAAKAPEELKALFGKAAQELGASTLLAQAMHVGQRAPDFELRDGLGQSVSLAELRKKGPVVLTFYRGKW